MDDTYNALVGINQDAKRMFVKSGGVLDIESGGAFQINEVDITAPLARMADPTSREVDVTAATLNVTAALHDARTILLDRSGGVVCTLPAATGSGSKFRFVVKTVGNPNKVQVANSNDIIQGTLSMLSDDGSGGPVKGFTAGGADDTITLNSTTTGGKSVGDYVELEDVAANLWIVKGMLSASGAETTPFSSAV